MRSFSKSYIISLSHGGQVTLVTCPKSDDPEWLGAPAIFACEVTTRERAARELRAARRFKLPILLQVGGVDYCEECGGDLPFCACDMEAQEEAEEEARNAARS